MTTEQAWETYQSSAIRYQRGLVNIDQVRRDYLTFHFFFTGHTAGNA